WAILLRTGRQVAGRARVAEPRPPVVVLAAETAGLMRLTTSLDRADHVLGGTVSALHRADIASGPLSVVVHPAQVAGELRLWATDDGACLGRMIWRCHHSDGGGQFSVAARPVVVLRAQSACQYGAIAVVRLAGLAYPGDPSTIDDLRFGISELEPPVVVEP